uniref:Uncharacterized protein n=1 Tax=Arundo donax TaxID=35708 RepID=A0A0A9ES61_ARUDO
MPTHLQDLKSANGLCFIWDACGKGTSYH